VRQHDLASKQHSCLRKFYLRAVAVNFIETIWLVTKPMDMHAGTETVMASVISVFGWRHAGAIEVSLVAL